MIHFTCPHCAQRVVVPDHAAGQAATCMTCRGSLVVPRPVMPAPPIEVPVKPNASRPLPQPQPPTERRTNDVGSSSGVLIALMIVRFAGWSVCALCLFFSLLNLAGNSPRNEVPGLQLPPGPGIGQVVFSIYVASTGYFVARLVDRTVGAILDAWRL